MSRIVDDLLTLSRAESGQLTLQSATLDLTETIEEVARALRVLTTERGVTLALELPDSMPFAGDRLLVQRIFSNLIENAVRHTVGATRVEVRGGRADGIYEIRIRDHGDGISPADVDRIFEPFFRGEGAKGIDGTTGAGLGLAIARSSAVMHGGDVMMVSTGPEGTVFQVTLPALT
jgi:signal transduction histidine kinase